MTSVEIEIPPKPEFVGVVRLALGALGRAESLEEETLDDLRIAVSEACANAVVASEEAGSEAAIKVAWTVADGSIVVDVKDPAPGPGSDGTADGTSRLDLSLSLLASLVDRIESEALPEGGRFTRLTLTR